MRRRSAAGARPCGRIGRTKPAKVVFGPGTFLNESVLQIGDQYAKQLAAIKADADRQYQAAYKLARGRNYSVARARKVAGQARDLAQYQALADAMKLALKYGILKQPQLNDPGFVAQIVFAGGKAAGTPKAKFAYLFPNANSSLIQVRLKPGLSDGQRQDAIAQVRAAIGMSDFRLRNGGQYVVTGAPVVLSDLTTKVTDAIVTLLIAGVLVMALVLALVFPARRRLLPLVVALAAVAITFGALSLIGASLTMASVGVVPVLIGLAVDYAIQLQARIAERTGRRDPSRGELVAAVGHVARNGAPAVAIAATATAAGFLVLGISPVPMVRGFGLLLVGGIFVGLLTALTLGTAALVGSTGRTRRLPGAITAAGALLGSAARGAGELLRDNPAARFVTRRGRAVRASALRAATRRPGRVLAIGLLVAVVGWAADTQTRVESDVTKLVPQDLPALQDLQALQKSTSVGGQIDVLVRSDRLTDPATLNWMRPTSRGCSSASATPRSGAAARRSCARRSRCPTSSAAGRQRPLTRRRRSTQLLDVVPPYFSQSVITADRRTATMAFGIRLMPLDRQKEVWTSCAPSCSAQGRQRAARGPAGAGRRRQRGRVVAVAAHAHARAGPDGRRAVLLVALPLLAPRADAAGADRAGDRLVGTGALRDAGPVEPHVGHARARWSSRSPPSSASCSPSATAPSAAAASIRRRAGADLPIHRRGGARLRRDGDRRLRRPRR